VKFRIHQNPESVKKLRIQENHKVGLFLLLLCFFSMVLSAENKHGNRKNTGNLHIKINDLNSDKGKVRVILYQSKDDFMNETKVLRKIDKKPSGKTVTVTFRNLPFHDYAVLLFHDENNNQKMDKNIIGIPSEKYGCSTNPGCLFFAPSFDDVKFELKSAEMTIKITAK